MTEPEHTFGPLMNGFTIAALLVQALYIVLYYVGHPIQGYITNIPLAYAAFFLPAILGIVSFFFPQRPLGLIVSVILSFVIGAIGMFALLALYNAQV